MAGKTVSHYTILEKLGEGGMGEVYLAEDSQLERKVALKFLPNRYLADMEINERFRREAKAAAVLNHPNIITVYEIGEHEGHAFIAMEYLDGQQLRAVLNAARDKPLPIRRVLDIAIQICEGLKKAHQSNIVHRDLKPENIMIDADGTVKILDFGLAHEIGKTSMSSDRSTMGTLFYMSPEHCDGQKIDHRTDIWAIGVMLYEMIAGHLPFEGEYSSAVMYSIMAEEPEPLARFKTNMPADGQHIIDKALDKDRETRYQHVDEMLVDLIKLKKHLAAGESKYPANSGRQRKPALAIASVALFSLTVFSIFAYSWIFTNGFDQKKERVESVRRIAVLPFDNLNHSDEFEYFADGMTDELIATLSRLDNLRVIARASVVPYKERDKNIKEISETLNVNVLLDGSVRIYNKHLRVSVQLIDVVSQENLWSQVYEKALDDVLVIQGDIAQNVADTLQIQLFPDDRKMIRHVGTKNIEAYKLYLKGRYCWNQRTPDCLQLSIDYFKQCIEMDSLYAQPYAGLADAFALLGSVEYGAMPPKKVMEAARTYALKAVELDSTLPEAYTSLANITLFYDWDWERAESYFKEAIRLNHNHATANHWYAIFLMLMGREEEAFDQIRQALQIDPLSMIINTDAGWFHYYMHDFQKASDVLEQTLKLDPHFAQANMAYGLTRLELGDYEKALEQFSMANIFLGEHPLTIAMLGYGQAISGDVESARSQLALLEEMAQNQYIPALYFVLVYMGLDDIDRAMDKLNAAYDERSGYLVYLNIDPKFDRLRSHPGFVQLLRKMKM